MIRACGACGGYGAVDITVNAYRAEEQYQYPDIELCPGCCSEGFTADSEEEFGAEVERRRRSKIGLLYSRKDLPF